MPVPSQESERSCICALGPYILYFYIIFLLTLGTVPTVWNFFILFFILIPHGFKKNNLLLTKTFKLKLDHQHIFHIAFEGRNYGNLPGTTCGHYTELICMVFYWRKGGFLLFKKDRNKTKSKNNTTLLEQIQNPIDKS